MNSLLNHRTAGPRTTRRSAGPSDQNQTRRGPAGRWFNRRLWRRFLAEETAATITEYAFMVVLIAVALLAIVAAVGIATQGLFRADDDALQKALDESTL